jgi:hypothetical protein
MDKRSCQHRRYRARRLAQGVTVLSTMVAVLICTVVGIDLGGPEHKRLSLSLSLSLIVDGLVILQNGFGQEGGDRSKMPCKR